MGFLGEVWRVRCGAGDIGEILIQDADFPWLAGRFTPGPAYEEVRELFARELALTRLDDDAKWATWETVYDEITRRVTLSSPDGPVPEFLLHIEGERAWFRWSDEPFEGEPVDEVEVGRGGEAGRGGGAAEVAGVVTPGGRPAPDAALDAGPTPGDR